LQPHHIRLLSDGGPEHAAFVIALCPIGGRVVDAVGPRLAAGFATIWWSFFTAVNAVAGGLASLVVFRLGLGIGEAVGPPAFGKVVGRWFPLRERAMAAAVFDSGSRLGTALALPIVTVIISVFGWRASFLITGCLGLVWVVGWFRLYRDPREHPRLDPAELAYIEDGGARTVLPAGAAPAVRGRWVDLLRHRTIWGMMIGFFCLNFVIYFFITWFPTYLIQARGFSLAQLGTLGLLPGLVSIPCGWLGGFTSDALYRRGWSLTAARKTCLVGGMLMSSVITLSVFAPNAYVALGCFAVAYGILAFAAASIWSKSSSTGSSSAEVTGGNSSSSRITRSAASSAAYGSSANTTASGSPT